MKLNYEEGAWFAVPVTAGGYGVGIVARAGKRGRVLLGYFFKSRYETVPSLLDVALLRPGDAGLVARFGDLYLIENRWPVIGKSPEWDRMNWPMPVFLRRDEIVGGAWEVRYSDTDPRSVVSEERVQQALGNDWIAQAGLWRDGLFGAEAIEYALEKMMA